MICADREIFLNDTAGMPFAATTRGDTPIATDLSNAWEKPNECEDRRRHGEAGHHGAPEHEAVGIVSSADVARRLKDETPIRRIMTENVTTVPAYNDVSAAARAMRNRKIHHLVVTHEKKVVGMISAFDLLKLVEGHRFVAKSAPTKSKKAR